VTTVIVIHFVVIFQFDDHAYLFTSASEAKHSEEIQPRLHSRCRKHYTL
jgi:hypothetical protein